MKRVYLVRHGESEQNIGVQPLGDEASLTDHGRKQAQFIAERTKSLPIEVIISSTLLRAKQTAQIVAEKIKKPIEFSDLFIERLMSSEQEEKILGASEVTKIDLQMLNQSTIPNHPHFDGENFRDLSERASAALKYLEKRTENYILVVSHGFFSRMLLGRALFGERFFAQEAAALVRSMKTTNTGLTLLDFEESDTWSDWRIATWNDHAHLAD